MKKIKCFTILCIILCFSVPCVAQETKLYKHLMIMIGYIHGAWSTSTDVTPKPLTSAYDVINQMKKQLHYIPDTSKDDTINLPETVIRQRGGDCEDLSLFFLACMAHKGMKPELLGLLYITPENKKINGHVMPIIFLPGIGQWVAFETSEFEPESIEISLVSKFWMKEKIGSFYVTILYGLRPRSLVFTTFDDNVIGVTMSLQDFLERIR